MRTLIAHIACAIGLHAWFSVIGWEVDERGRLMETRTDVCATCPARRGTVIRGA